MKKLVLALLSSACIASAASAQTITITPEAVTLGKKLGISPSSKGGKLILTFTKETSLTCDPDKTKDLYDKFNFWDKYGMRAFTITIPEQFTLTLDSVKECKAEGGNLIIKRGQETWVLVDTKEDGDGGHIIKDGTDLSKKHTPYSLFDYVIAYSKTQAKKE